MKMMIIVTAIALLGIAAGADEVDKCKAYVFGKFTEGGKVFLYADKVNVRNRPGLKGSSVIANLPAAYPVKIIKATPIVEKINQYLSNWYEVGFKYKGSKMRGYIWGGLLSIVTLDFGVKGSDLKFVYGIKSIKNSDYDSSAKIVRNGKVVSEVIFDPISLLMDGPYEYTVSGLLYGSRGFNNIKNIIKLSFTYEACGYPNGDIVLLYDGRKLSYGTEAVSVAEAGVFHFTTKIIFPDKKGGKKNTLVKVETSENFNEKKNRYDLVKTEKIIYKWNGEKLILLKSSR